MQFGIVDPCFSLIPFLRCLVFAAVVNELEFDISESANGTRLVGSSRVWVVWVLRLLGEGELFSHVGFEVCD